MTNARIEWKNAEAFTSFAKAVGVTTTDVAAVMQIAEDPYPIVFGIYTDPTGETKEDSRTWAQTVIFAPWGAQATPRREIPDFWDGLNKATLDEKLNKLADTIVAERDKSREEQAHG